MKDLLLSRSLLLINRYYKKYSDNEIERMRYGLEAIYLNIFKLLIILVCALLLGVFKEVILVLLAYNLLRFFAFGMHARSSRECLIISIIIFVGIPYIIFNQLIVLKPFFGLYLLFFFAFLLFSPSDTLKRPLLNKKKRFIRKILSLFIISGYFILSSFVFNYYFDLIFLTASLIEFIMINPITYKIFRQPYMNYKKFSYK